MCKNIAENIIEVRTNCGRRFIRPKSIRSDKARGEENRNDTQFLFKFKGRQTQVFFFYVLGENEATCTESEVKVGKNIY